ncbi:sodium/potassium-transporting ATPase subunit beta-3a isoform X2 [Clupea harengus]|uniref:Sodium/potassium-transporting ATPase subunit beta n=1 Tax=Clupea harengus TaxID=7950 RepID=A0A6P8EUA7_CLUHA|nr:sodium/potassium-transporting ATPase subunit beta-3a isoform X2 [Clupea harengus]
MTKEEQKPGEGKEGKTRWTDCIYNPRTGEFIGRNASSWGLILLFYLVFYGFLAGFFCLTMWVMLLTLEDHVPKYNDRVPSPGLVIRPKSLDIVYNRSDPANYGQYIRHLDTFLQRYNDSEQASNELCLAGEFYDQDAEAQKKACQFRRSTLRICSGISDPNYGYSEGKPCILVKMNRIIGLKPQGEPYVNCTAKEKYVQPLVAVKLLLTKEDYNKEITVECRVEGSNLRNNDERDKFLGRVTFRVLVTQ